MTDLCDFAGQSPECQYRAVTAMITALSGDVILYEAFDDLWKFDPSHRQYDKYFVVPLIISANDRDCTRVRRHHEISGHGPPELRPGREIMGWFHKSIVIANKLRSTCGALIKL